MASSKAAPHLSGLHFPIAPIFNDEILQHFVPDMIEREICIKTNRKNAQDSIQYIK